MLNREEILNLIKEEKLIEGFIDLETQATPNGFDLTASGISAFKAQGALDFSNKERVVPAAREIPLKKTKAQGKFGTSTTLSADGEQSRTIGWWHLKKGAYKIKTNETVNLPNDLIAMAFSRTSLLRMGAFTQHGVWDAGFCGRGEFVLVVENPKGIKIKQNARVAQLIFTRINQTLKGYQGIYKNL